jgi:hypothetical protein
MFSTASNGEYVKSAFSYDVLSKKPMATTFSKPNCSLNAPFKVEVGIVSMQGRKVPPFTLSPMAIAWVLSLSAEKFCRRSCLFLSEQVVKSKYLLWS